MAKEILEDGGERLFQMDAKKVILYEELEEGEQAYAEVDSWKWGYPDVKEIRPHVPKNTVIEEYRLENE